MTPTPFQAPADPKTREGDCEMKFWALASGQRNDYCKPKHVMLWCMSMTSPFTHSFSSCFDKQATTIAQIFSNPLVPSPQPFLTALLLPTNLSLMLWGEHGFLSNAARSKLCLHVSSHKQIKVITAHGIIKGPRMCSLTWTLKLWKSAMMEDRWLGGSGSIRQDDDNKGCPHSLASKLLSTVI